jgi:hypothetical protein
MKVFLKLSNTVAVYLYDMEENDMEENPIACVTLEPASEEETKMYEEMFYGGSAKGGQGGDGLDAAMTIGVDMSSGGRCLC